MAEQRNQQQSTTSSTSTSGVQGSSGQMTIRRDDQRGISRHRDLISPWTMMQRLSAEMDRLFDDFGLFPRLGFSSLSTFDRLLDRMWSRAIPMPQAFSPQIEIFDRNGTWTVRADLPGVEKDDVRIELMDDALVLEGERRHESEEQQADYYRSERSYGAFRRMIAIPPGVDTERANATFRNGVLEITMPYTESERRRRIEIRDEPAGNGKQTGKKAVS